MKKVLILYGKNDWNKNKPFDSDKYRECYEYFYKMAGKKGLKIFRASYQWYDEEKNIFKHAWFFDGTEWKRTENIKPDLVFDKTKSRLEVHYFKERLAKHYKIINDPEFTMFANHKFLSSLLFPKYFKKYHKVKNGKELSEISENISGETVVLKPVNGSGGDGVRIIDKKNIGDVEVKDELIVQEFIDSSRGIDGIVEGVHDLRLVFINEELVYSYVRQPAKGSLLANLAQGGSMFIVEKEKLPQSVLEIASEVQEAFKFYNPRIFTIDFIFDQQQKPWIVEFNTMPGMYFSPDQKEWMDRMYGKLIDTLISAI